MMVQNAFRHSARARCVVQRDGVPLVLRLRRRNLLGAEAEQFVIGHFAKTLALAGLQDCAVIDDVDHVDAFSYGKRRFEGRRELGIGDQELAPAVTEDVCDRRRIEADIDGVQDRACHRHAEMRFEQLRRVGGEHRYGVALIDAEVTERICQPAGPIVDIAPRVPTVPIYDGGMRREHAAGPAKKR